MAQKQAYAERTAVEKLGVKSGERVEVTGDVGPRLRKEVKEAAGRGLVKSGELDGAIVAVGSLEDAHASLIAYRPRIKDTGYLWLITRKRGHDDYFPQMTIVPGAKKVGLIDNKTCSVDGDRSGIRFVVPRALRKPDTASKE